MVEINRELKPTQPEGDVCGNCHWFAGNKDKHNTEGQCRINPPIVFPNPIRKPITNEIVMSQIQLLPIVVEDFYCGQFEERS